MKVFLLEMFSDEIDCVLFSVHIVNFVKIVGESKIQNSDWENSNLQKKKLSTLYIFIFFSFTKFEYITVFSWINLEKFKDI